MASGDNSSFADVAVRVATVPLSANSAAWTTAESAALISATAALTNGSVYKLQLFTHVQSTVTTEPAQIRIREDNATGTQVAITQTFCGTTSGNGFFVYIYAEYTAVATANKVFVVTGQRNGGSASQTLVASPTKVSYLTIDRIVS